MTLDQIIDRLREDEKDLLPGQKLKVVALVSSPCGICILDNVGSEAMRRQLHAFADVVRQPDSRESDGN